MLMKEYTNDSGEYSSRHQVNMDAEMGAGMPLAIVGMSCRFPGGSNSPELLWDFLKNGKSGWTQDAGNRFHLNAFYHPAAELGGVVSS